VGLFEDVSNFLENRLEEFIRNNPHLELQALLEQLREQEEDTLRLIGNLQREEQQLETKILATAEDVKRWHIRGEKANAANRQDLAQAAQEREGALLRQGNQLWGQMKGVKERLQKARDLQHQLKVRQEAVRVKAEQVNTEQAQKKAEPSSPSPNSETKGWNQSPNSSFSTNADSLEQEFQRWELDEELAQMKKNMGNQ
jgi:uncharacterized protein (TIGR04376 family)